MGFNNVFEKLNMHPFERMPKAKFALSSDGEAYVQRGAVVYLMNTPDAPMAVPFVVLDTPESITATTRVEAISLLSGIKTKIFVANTMDAENYCEENNLCSFFDDRMIAVLQAGGEEAITPQPEVDPDDPFAITTSSQDEAVNTALDEALITNQEIPVPEPEPEDAPKKKRGRPKKEKAEGEPEQPKEEPKNKEQKDRIDMFATQVKDLGKTLIDLASEVDRTDPSSRFRAIAQMADRIALLATRAEHRWKLGSDGDIPVNPLVQNPNINYQSELRDVMRGLQEAPELKRTYERGIKTLKSLTERMKSLCMMLNEDGNSEHVKEPAPPLRDTEGNRIVNPE